MSYTNETTHYHIPKPLGTDLTTPMDYNEAADAIDTAVWGAVQDAAQATSDASDAKTTANGAASDVATLSEAVATLSGTVASHGTSIGNLSNEVDDVRADLSDAICAIKEASATAAYAHAVDTYFWYNDTLYRTTQAIAIGDTIVPNTNCVTTNAAHEIADIKDDLHEVFDNNYGSAVVITTTAWTASRDGYAVLNSATLESGDMKLVVIDSNGVEHGLLSHQITGRYQTYSVFVRKGMSIKITTDTTSGVAANFYGLVP